MDKEARYRGERQNHVQAVHCQMPTQKQKVKVVELIFHALHPFLASIMEKNLNINQLRGLTCHKKQVLELLIHLHVMQRM